MAGSATFGEIELDARAGETPADQMYLVRYNGTTGEPRWAIDTEGVEGTEFLSTATAHSLSPCSNTSCIMVTGDFFAGVVFEAGVENSLTAIGGYPRDVFIARFELADGSISR